MELSSHELIKHICEVSDDPFMRYDEYDGKQEEGNKKYLDFSSPSKHQFSIVNSKEGNFTFVSDDDVARDDDKEASAYLSERIGKSSNGKILLSPPENGSNTLSARERYYNTRHIRPGRVIFLDRR